MMRIKNLNLEMSGKPFKDDSAETEEAVCRTLFKQWSALIGHADTVSVMLWTSDGSEILDYSGDGETEFEWAKWQGVANPRWTSPDSRDPGNQSFNRTPVMYLPNPPAFNYRRLRRLASTLKRLGGEMTGKQVQVGATFDPGPEFAISAFKYRLHNEICMASTMGNKSFVCCYATLQGDIRHYAGFPDGIPDGTSFGTFLGRQCFHFIRDMGFDFIWFSNGFGFGLETWAYTGAVFDGGRFEAAKTGEVSERILSFWRSFREECPGVPIRTRGTNFTTGIDLASDAVPLRDIYSEFKPEPPPNSPWAVINGDFGLELVGWMSHIAELPDEHFPFRFYTHDPWFLNSPWLDRYEREPHDIYLPLSVCRLDANGEPRTPTTVSLLTVDNSWGDMPEQVPNEVTPHLLRAIGSSPDQAGPIVWIYPFDEYHDMTLSGGGRLDEVFFGDWFVRGAVNQGFPLNTVISSRNFQAAVEANPSAFRGAILVAPAAALGNKAFCALMEFVEKGGMAILYGPLRHAAEMARNFLNVKTGEALDGEFKVESALAPDMSGDKPSPTGMAHSALISGGGLSESIDDVNDSFTTTYASARRKGECRVVALKRSMPKWNNGVVAWVRGTVSCHERSEGRLLIPLDQNKYFYSELLMRHVLADLGIHISYEKLEPAQRNPMVLISRHRGSFQFSGFMPDATVDMRLRLPIGAPLLTGLDTILRGGKTTYRIPGGWRRECRAFVDQSRQGKLSCHERCVESPQVKRRLLIEGLASATLSFYPEPGGADAVKLLPQSGSPFVNSDFLPMEKVNDAHGLRLVARDVSGPVLISW